jgi:REP element-mobilizing transposase RayT
MGAMPLEINGMDDHGHVLPSLKSKHRLDHFMRDLKGESSLWSHRGNLRECLKAKKVQRVLGKPTAVGIVKRYIASQKEHHRRADLKTEYVEAGIELEERFLW